MDSERTAGETVAEEIFNILKRALNLGYLWTGSVNGIQLQLWATWLFYTVLFDLSLEPGGRWLVVGK